MPSLWRMMITTVTMAWLGLSNGCATARSVHISGVQDGKPLHVTPQLGARIELLGVALLEGCSYENDEGVANQTKWTRYAEGEHVAIRFGRPREVCVLRESFAITDLLIPLSRERSPRSPPYLFARTADGRIRAFCKYRCEYAESLRAALGEIGG